MSENKYLIIDGQQRITVITMILACLKKLHSGRINTIDPCKLSIESFEGFGYILENHFPVTSDLSATLLQSDKLNQLAKYYYLWQQINCMDCITNSHEARSFIENLGKSDINIILNKSDDAKDGIRYFIDVNLKGKQLDIEDIFKGYLFRNDAGTEIRNEWYKFKANVSRVDKTKMKYPLLKLLEHYFYCDLYNDSKYRGLNIGEDFLLDDEFRMHGDPTITFRSKTHLIEVINNNEYMLNSLRKLNKIVEIALNIVINDSPNVMFRDMFKCNSEGGRSVRIDSDELKIIYNFIGKILKDDKLLPKALIMKYILTVLVDQEEKPKEEYRKIYGVYLLSVLFVIFENKKSIDVFISVLKASGINWYTEIVTLIKSYFEPSKITDNKIIAQYKHGTNEESEDYRFRCKSLATIYNYFKIEREKVVISGSLSRLKQFLTDDNLYTTEHLIISNDNNRRMKVIIEDHEYHYVHAKEFFNKYVNSLFNFIFIDEEQNSSLSNYWLPKKMQLLGDPSNLKCEYSKMVISKLTAQDGLCDKMNRDITAETLKDKFDLYFNRDFKEEYIVYARDVLSSVISKIKNDTEYLGDEMQTSLEASSY